MSKDELVTTLKIHKTYEYDKFVPLKGARAVDKKHVNYLVSKLRRKNLVQEQPIEITDNWAILDGAHRIQALKILNMPVYYVIKPLMNSDDMIEINTGQRNWGWRDFAASFSVRGNKNYTQFLELYNEYGGRFHTLLLYTGGVRKSAEGVEEGGRSKFNLGEFVMEDFETTKLLLGRLDDISQTAKISTASLDRAVYAFIRNPNYDHDRMLQQIRKYGEVLKTCYLLSDYIFELEKIYNTHK